MKYIALDIGNVLCFTNMNDFISDISDTFNVSITDATRFLRSFQQMHDLGLTTMEHQLRLNFNCRSEATMGRLVNRWNDSIREAHYMTEMLAEAANKHDYQIALVSNIGVEHADMMRDKLNPIYDNAIKHFSCFVGARKPTMLYYQSFLMQYPQFKGCLYVDDLQENLDASLQFGFKPYRFSLEDPEPQAKFDEIKALILESP